MEKMTEEISRKESLPHIKRLHLLACAAAEYSDDAAGLRCVEKLLRSARKDIVNGKQPISDEDRQKLSLYAVQLSEAVGKLKKMRDISGWKFACTAVSDLIQRLEQEISAQKEPSVLEGAGTKISEALGNAIGGVKKIGEIIGQKAEQIKKTIGRDES